jgi:hypothetical protein
MTVGELAGRWLKQAVKRDEEASQMRRMGCPDDDAEMLAHREASAVYRACAEEIVLKLDSREK